MIEDTRDREKLRRALYGYIQHCQTKAESLLDAPTGSKKLRLRMIAHWRNETAMAADLLARLCGEELY